MELLRERAGLTGVKKGKQRNNDDDLERAFQERDERERGEARDPERAAEAGPSTLTSASGHINLFEDLERVSPHAPSPSQCASRHRRHTASRIHPGCA